MALIPRFLSQYQVLNVERTEIIEELAPPEFSGAKYVTDRRQILILLKIVPKSQCDSIWCDWLRIFLLHPFTLTRWEFIL